MQQWFLPVGLVLAIVIAFLAPGPGSALNAAGLVLWLVPVIFLANGYQTRLEMLRVPRRFVGVLLAGAAICLLVGPFVGLGVALLLGLPASVALGLVVMSAMPPTLSSGVTITGNAGGHVPWAMLLTIFLNLAGIFTVPFMLELVLEQGAGVAISPWPLLERLLLAVLLPFAVGAWLRHRLRRHPPAWVRYTPSGCIVLTIWMSVSGSSTTLQGVAAGAYAVMVVAALGVHGTLLLACHAAGGGLGLARGERLALLFVASQKTLPVAIGVLTALDAPIAGALVLCIVYHFAQLIFDSALAARLVRR